MKDYDPSELFKSRFEKTLIHCPNPECGKVMGSKLGNTFWYRQNKRGQSVDTKIEMNLASGSSYKVECTYCGYKHAFIVIEESIKIGEELTAKTEKV